MLLHRLPSLVLPETPWWVMAMTVLVVAAVLARVLSMRSQQRVSDVDVHALSPSIGVCAIQGRRDYMEDTFAVIDQPTLTLASVFDGHGGSEASIMLKHSLHSEILARIPKLQPSEALRQGYDAMERLILERSSTLGWGDGSTAVTVYVYRRRMFVAGLGDSRAVLGSLRDTKVRTRDLTKDHKASCPKERQDIVARGGRVVHMGIWRVEGQLAVSRAFGDRHLKEFVGADPDVTEYRIDQDEDKVVIVATDGLWDVMSSEEAVEIVLAMDYKGKADAAAKKLVSTAYYRGSSDNITCIVLQL